jgi:hypothetical protein
VSPELAGTLLVREVHDRAQTIKTVQEFVGHASLDVDSIEWNETVLPPQRLFSDLL